MNHGSARRPTVCVPHQECCSAAAIHGGRFHGLFLVIGLATRVLPLHVRDGLGLGTFMVVLLAGNRFSAPPIARPWAGHYPDRRGPKHAVLVGLMPVVASGLLYLLSLRFLGSLLVSLVILLMGRALLDGVESVTITAAVSWGLAFASPQSTARIIAWIGAVMFGAFANGAPVGSPTRRLPGSSFWLASVSAISRTGSAARK